LFKRKKVVDPPTPVNKGVKEKNRVRGFIMLGLALGMLLAGLDGTIVSTSLPKIVGELGGMSLYAWLFTAYMLAETCVIPIAGKMSDRYGRKPVFLVGMGLFMGGSILAGMSQNMEQLIMFRAIQGLGGGALMPVAMSTVADLYAPTERGKIQGILGAIFAITSIVGPFIGGFIVDNLDWRWVFYVNIPVGILAIIITSFKFPSIEADKSKPIDFTGMVTLTAGLLSGLLVLSWGGNDFAWDSAEIIALAAVSVATLIGFVLVERRAKDPILSLHLFKEPIFSLGCVALMVMSLGMFGVISYLPLFLQVVIGMSATYSGEVLIPFMIGAMMGSITSGFLLKRTGYKVWLVSGPLIAAGGLFLMSTMHVGTSMWDAMVFLFITGLGLGFVMSNYIVAAQNVVSKAEIGVVTSAMSLFRGVGGTIGVCVLGAFMNREFSKQLAVNLPAGAASILPTTNASSLGNMLMTSQASLLPADIVEAIKVSLSNSITYMFLIATIFVIGAWIASLFIRSVPLKSVEEYHEEGGVEEKTTE
jgi:EmrB/QacA subfamily drug resistance transporter